MSEAKVKEALDRLGATIASDPATGTSLDVQVC